MAAGGLRALSLHRTNSTENTEHAIFVERHVPVSPPFAANMLSCRTVIVIYPGDREVTGQLAAVAQEEARLAAEAAATTRRQQQQNKTGRRQRSLSGHQLRMQ
jgi:hypothetical protein